MGIYEIEGVDKLYDSLTKARAGAMKHMNQSRYRQLAVFDYKTGHVVGEIVFDYHYESSYAWAGYDDKGKYFYKPLYKDGTVGPNRKRK